MMESVQRRIFVSAVILGMFNLGCSTAKQPSESDIEKLSSAPPS